ncbi:MAG TPA: FMN-binding protein [Kiritimatiellia bacterium]|nr:FMN-binding protein [Kiritimatiellia bacterium]HRZ12744.1 FMN-binding protein [Kiritimatiellia bacterium]HSA18304.1 FMN-binding protein [Kiritimatiellia bacterium]
MKNSYIGQAWLVIVLSLVFGAALAGVQAALKPRIEQNKLNDTLGQIPSLVPGATTGQAETIGGQTVYRALNDQGEQVGWMIPARGLGFADVLDLLVGLNKDLSRVTGLSVLEQKETPGLGDRITEPRWRDQFKGKPTIPDLVVTKTAPKSDSEIQGVTGATISSVSVAGIVNGAVARLREGLRE